MTKIARCRVGDLVVYIHEYKYHEHCDTAVVSVSIEPDHFFEREIKNCSFGGEFITFGTEHLYLSKFIGKVNGGKK